MEKDTLKAINIFLSFMMIFIVFILIITIISNSNLKKEAKEENEKYYIFQEDAHREIKDLQHKLGICNIKLRSY